MALDRLKNQPTSRTLIFGKISSEIDCGMLDYAILPLIFIYLFFYQIYVYNL